VNREVSAALRAVYCALADKGAFPPLRGKGLGGLATPGFDLGGDDLGQTLHQLIAVGQRYKHDQTSTVAAVAAGGQRWVIKRYNHQGWLHGLKRCLASSRARKSFVRGLVLRHLGIPTPRPIAYLDTRRGPLPGDGYIICEQSRGETLHQLLMSGQLDRRRWPAVVALTRELVLRLHALGITHGDIKPTNLLLDGDRLEIIDLDSLGIHRWRWSFERQRRKDIRALDTRIGGDPAAYVARKKIELGLD